MSDGNVTLRRKLPEIAVEAVMVVFAVFAAFGVEEWRDERQLRQFAAVAREAVETEIAENLQEFRTVGPALDALTAELDELLQAARDGSVELHEELNLGVRMPRTSTAAWRAAQGSQAAPYFDYDWVIHVSRVYELYEGYTDVRSQVVEEYGRIAARRASFQAMTPAEFIDVFEPLSGSLWTLGQLHREMQGGLETLAE